MVFSALLALFLISSLVSPFAFFIRCRTSVYILSACILSQIDLHARLAFAMADGAQLLPFPTLPADAHCVYIHGVQHKISTNDEGTIISQSALDCGGYAALAERFASIEVFAHDTLSEDEINDVAERFSEIQKYVPKMLLGCVCWF